MLINSIRQNSIILGICAVITALLLAITYQGTKDRIAAAERKAAEKALLEIIPAQRHSNDMLVDTLEIPQHLWPTLGLEAKDEPRVHVAMDGGEPVAIIVTAIAADGYNGDIKKLIGINLDGTIAGVRVIKHQETPGLGDKVDTNKSDWILSFNGKSLQNPGVDKWQVRKDGGHFDQFTGATITPRAIVNQVRKALLYFEEDRQRLLKEAKKLPVDSDRQHQTAESDHG